MSAPPPTVRDRRWVVALSPLQEHLWSTLHHAAPGEPHARQLAVMLEGELDAGALQEALDRVVSRHDLLRLEVDGDRYNPRGRVRARAALAIEWLSVACMPGEDARAVAGRAMRDGALLPVDVRAGPALRCGVLATGAQQFLLMLAAHCMIADGESLRVVMHELLAAYAQRKAGEPLLPGSPPQYPVLAARERARRSDPHAQEQWSERLAGAAPPSGLAFGRLPGARSTGSTWCERAAVSCAAPVAGDTGRLAWLLAGLGAVLHRHGGQEKVLVALEMVADRPPGVVGPATTVLAIPVEVDARHSLGEIARRTAEVLACARRQPAPPELAVFAAWPPRIPVLVRWGDARAASWPRLPGLEVRDLGLPPRPLPADLVFSAWPGHDGLDLTLESGADVFDAPAGRELVHQLHILLREAAHRTDTPAAQLPLMTAQDRDEILSLARGPAAMPGGGPGAFVHEHVSAWAARTPHATALVADEVQVSYGELERRANRLAHRLRARGVGPECVVALLLDRSVELVVAVLAVLKAGGAFLPLDPAWPRAWHASVLRDSGARLLLSRRGAGLADWDGPVLDVDARADDGRHDEEHPPQVVLRPGQPAYVLCTSGTTGVPKVVISPHARTPERNDFLQAVYGFSEHDRHLLKSATGFTLLVREIFWPLRHGATLFVVPPGDAQDPAGLAHRLRRDRISHVSVVPSVLRALLEEPDFLDAADLRHVVCFGEALGGDVQQRFLARHHARLSVFYGATEAPSATFIEHRAGESRPGVCIGTPLAGREVFVLDPALDPVPFGVPGEVCVAGGLARGYGAQAGATAERFVPHPFSGEPGARLYRTGDLARVGRDGTLEFLGRADDQAQVRGARTEPRAVESTLGRHENVREAAVVVGEDARGAPGLVAYVVARSQPAPTGRELRIFLRERLPAYMVPASFVALDRLPRTPGGKLDRRALPAPSRERSCGPGDQPREGLEQRLADIWCEVLGLAATGREEDFFDLGGDSLLSAVLLARVQQLTGVRVAPGEFVRSADVAGLARLVGAGSRAIGDGLIVPVRRGGEFPPLFFVPGGGSGEVEIAYVYHDFVDALDPRQPVYGLRVPGARPGEERLGTVEQIAREFAAEIRRMQPAGPYYLGGDCVGGVLAYETARQLTDTGAQVALLALLESQAPAAGAETRLQQRQKQRARARLRHAARHWLDRSRHWAARIVRTRPGHWAHSAGVALRGARAMLEARRLDEETRRARALHQGTVSRYRPQAYKGRVTLVLAAESAGADPTRGWAHHARGGVEVLRVPGNHRTYIREHAAAVAACLEGCLGRARQAVGRGEPGVDPAASVSARA